jgi:hypothetical protein
MYLDIFKKELLFYMMVKISEYFITILFIWWLSSEGRCGSKTMQCRWGAVT